MFISIFFYPISHTNYNFLFSFLFYFIYLFFFFFHPGTGEKCDASLKAHCVKWRWIFLSVYQSIFFGSMSPGSHVPIDSVIYLKKHGKKKQIYYQGVNKKYCQYKKKGQKRKGIGRKKKKKNNLSVLMCILLGWKFIACLANLRLVTVSRILKLNNKRSTKIRKHFDCLKWITIDFSFQFFFSLFN